MPPAEIVAAQLQPEDVSEYRAAVLLTADEALIRALPQSWPVLVLGLVLGPAQASLLSLAPRIEISECGPYDDPFRTAYLAIIDWICRNDLSPNEVFVSTASPRGSENAPERHANEELVRAVDDVFWGQSSRALSNPHAMQLSTEFCLSSARYFAEHGEPFHALSLFHGALIRDPFADIAFEALRALIAGQCKGGIVADWVGRLPISEADQSALLAD